MLRRTLLLLVVVPLLVANTSSAYYPTSAERYAFRDLNDARRNAGRHSLRYNASVSACAHRHSARMAARWRLYHSSCTSKRENVGYATSIHRVLQLWLQSWSHRVNLMCSCSRVAVGVTRRGSYYFITEIYW